jgi:short-chain fatty acids transporter
MVDPPGNMTWLQRAAQRCCGWSERWFPDAFAFAVLAVALVACGAVLIGAPPQAVAENFGSGFWSLIPFTMQMTFIIIGGYVVADSPPVDRLVHRLAAVPKSARGAVAWVALFGTLTSLIHWGLSLVFSSVLIRALARRKELNVDYRAAGAAACTGLGSVWALGLSSSAAQLEANPGSMPPALLAETGVIPFSETIFRWQSLLLAAVLVGVSTWVAWKTAPDAGEARTAERLGIDLDSRRRPDAPRTRPGECWNGVRSPRCSSRLWDLRSWRTSSPPRAQRPPFPISTLIISFSSSRDYCCSGGRGASSTRWRAAYRASPAC